MIEENLLFFCVAVAFICISVLIFSTQGIQVTMTESSIVHVDQPPVTRITKHKVGIPFFCNIKKTDNDELELEVSVEDDCFMRTLWLVSMDKLMDYLHLPWSQFKRIMDESSLESEKADVKRHLSVDGSPHIIKLSEMCDLSSLGPPPRLKFPLVIIMMREFDQPTDNNSEVGALISIAHIKDGYCTMPSTIIYNYLKQYSGPLVLMKGLFTQSENVNEVDAAVGCDGLCVICRVTPPTRAFLPCRHVCVCAPCFGQLEICPMCRTPIQSFFVTRSEDGFVDDEQEKPKGVLDSALSYIYSWFT